MAIKKPKPPTIQQTATEVELAALPEGAKAASVYRGEWSGNRERAAARTHLHQGYGKASAKNNFLPLISRPIHARSAKKTRVNPIGWPENAALILYQ